MNIIQIYKRFPDQESCLAHLEAARWGGEPSCPYCKSTNTAASSDGRRRHRCYGCKTSFSVTVGTIFHHTHLPLQKWFLAIMLVLNAEKGLSALQLSRDLEVNKNTAWRITMQIRKAMTQVEQRELLTGIVEMEEAYIGAKPRKGTKGDGEDGKHKGGRGTKKARVVGAVKRGGRVTAKAVRKDKMKDRHIRALVKDRAHADASALVTDGNTTHRGVAKLPPHAVIRHAYWHEDGDLHANSIEWLWAPLKRRMFGQSHSVSRRHLQRYVDESCYCYNLRNADPLAAFELTIKRGLGVAQ